MAKRKRLSAPNPAFAAEMPPLETKSVVVGKAPIAGVAADAATTAALDEVTSELSAARREGRMIVDLPLMQIDMDYLVRDRLVEDDEAMHALVASLEARGQQVPVEVTDLGDGRYGLISGWRRCQALTQLGHTTVSAVLRTLHEASDAYLAMVEENEIRAGLSYYERARIVVRATEQEVFPNERAALSVLFQSGSRARRSKIGTFVHIVHALDGVLRFPGALTERIGLQLGRALQDDTKLGAKMVASLQQTGPQDAAAEARVLLSCLGKADSNKAKQTYSHAESARAPCPGISMKTHSDGSVTLSGKHVDAAFRERLLDWLKSQS